MRIDKFLNAVNITKRRTIAQDMIDNKVIKIAGIPVKASRNVKVGDIIEIAYLEKSRFFEVLQIPSQKLLKKKNLLFIIKRFKTKLRKNYVLLCGRYRDFLICKTHWHRINTK